MDLCRGEVNGRGSGNGQCATIGSALKSRGLAYGVAFTLSWFYDAWAKLLRRHLFADKKLGVCSLIRMGLIPGPRPLAPPQRLC